MDRTDPIITQFNTAALARSETAPCYTAAPIFPHAPERSLTAEQQDDATIAAAKDILARRLARRAAVANDGFAVTSSAAVKDYLTLALAQLEHEEFHVLYLSTQHRLIHHERHTTGTIDSASVYPRRILRAALDHNAAAVILAHNHPSGTTDPSQADKAITQRIEVALGYVNVNVLDHIIVGCPGVGDGALSFKEEGLL
jgi:DNA repair protein RadC